MVIWLTRSPERRPLLGRHVAEMPPELAYVGWWPADVSGEAPAPSWPSRHAVYVVADDFSANLTVSEASAPRARHRHERAIAAVLQDARTSRSPLTDGDNLQYSQHARRRLWDTPRVGVSL